jgi:predicted Zn-dependent peptidase
VTGGARAASAANGASGDMAGSAFEVHSTETASGGRVVTEEVASVRSVALGLWVRTGSRNEAPAQAGVSHFL